MISKKNQEQLLRSLPHRTWTCNIEKDRTFPFTQHSFEFKEKDYWIEFWTREYSQPERQTTHGRPFVTKISVRNSYRDGNPRNVVSFSAERPADSFRAAQEKTSELLGEWFAHLDQTKENP